MAGESGKGASPARGGVFSKTPDPLAEAFTQSHTFDRALFPHDIQGSLAHAQMLFKVGLLKKSEAETIRGGLTEILNDYEEGRFSFRSEDEDVHMNIERALHEKIGGLAGKLHTARSRNDQVALDERLWLRAESLEVDGLLHGLQQVLVEKAELHAADVMPGYTHLQRAQPVTCGHYLLAFVEMLERDRARFGDARRRANVLPLGVCALAGTSLPIDRKLVAELLGFDGVTRNSMDTTADRDFLLDFAYALSVGALHLSRLCEDFILYATTEFGFLQIDEAFSTGSSIMPQKRNPDVLELVRGKTGRAAGCLLHLMMMLKGLPLTYNRDVQEDKELLFAASGQFKGCLQILSVLLPKVTFRRERMAEACEAGFMDATALAEYLVQRGIPFRQAHHAAGKLVKLAMRKGVPLAELTDDELHEVHALLGHEVRSVLGSQHVVENYASIGSSNPKMVQKEIRAWRRRLASNPPE